MNYSFLWKEISEWPDTPHKVYRAIRAVCRLCEEGELILPEMQLNLAKSLMKSLECHYTSSAQTVETLPALTGRVFLVRLRLKP